MKKHGFFYEEGAAALRSVPPPLCKFRTAVLQRTSRLPGVKFAARGCRALLASPVQWEPRFARHCRGESRLLQRIFLRLFLTTY